MAVMHVQKRVIKSHASGHELNSPLGSGQNSLPPHTAIYNQLDTFLEVFQFLG